MIKSRRYNMALRRIVSRSPNCPRLWSLFVDPENLNALGSLGDVLFIKTFFFFFKEETKQSVELLQKLSSRRFPVFLTLKGWHGFVKEGLVMRILQRWFSSCETSASLRETWKHLQFEDFVRLACFANSALGTHFWNRQGEYIISNMPLTFLPSILAEI